MIFIPCKHSYINYLHMKLSLPFFYIIHEIVNKFTIDLANDADIIIIH